METIKNLPEKIKKQMRTALILACAAATFIVPAFGGGYSALKNTELTSSAAAIEDVDLLLVAASAFGEARKVMNATDLDDKDQFISNTSAIVTSSKWHNVGLIVGARDALSGSTWSAYQSPITLSKSEVKTYGDGTLEDAYDKYKAFGFAVQNLNNSAQKSNTTSVSMDDGLDAMSEAAIKLGSLGTKFLNDYNPGPVLLSLYDSSNLSKYSSNKLVQIVINNEVLKNVITLFGDKIQPVNVSFFLLVNAVIAVVGFALSLFLTLLGNRTIGDGLRHFLVRIVVGTVGIYLIANVMSTMLQWVTDSILTMNTSPESSYVENNLNVYDWYQTGFQLPASVELQIDASGNFIFTNDIVRKINEYTYERLTNESPSDEAMKERMEAYAQNGNVGTASFITPSMSSADGADAWATDVYYAIMNNYAQNKDLMDGNDEVESPLYGKTSFSIYLCRYLWMSSLSISENGDGWSVHGNGSDTYYGLNPISAFNLVRSDFAGEAITSTATVYPAISYVSFDTVNSANPDGSNNMNSITRFIASFTLVLAAMKGLITIITAGFGNMISGGVKTAFGSAHGLGQALGAVVAMLGGLIGISVIMSMTLSLLDTLYGICKELLVGTAVGDAFLEPLHDTLGKIPFLGPILTGAAKTGVDLILTLILSLTFPKLGGIPITTFASFIAEIPSRIAERAQMIESQLMSGRSSAGGGLPPRHGGGMAGRQAQQMMGQAWNSSTRQAAAIIGTGAAGVGSIAGAAMTKAGKALNKKGDQMEGKPANPGISNWDEMTPEQQRKAAEAAGNTENWAQMDEDARQRALQEAGVFEEGNAQAGGNAPDTNQNIGDAPETAEDGAAEGGETPVEQNTIEDDSPYISDIGSEYSMNAPVEEAGDAGISGIPGTDGADGVMAGVEEGQHIESASGNGGSSTENVEGGQNTENGSISESAAGGQNTENGSISESAAGGQNTENGSISESAAGGSSYSESHIENGGSGTQSGSLTTVANGGSLDVNNNSVAQGGNQKFDTHVEQKNKTEAKNVDLSNQIHREAAGELQNNTLDAYGTGRNANTGLPDSAGNTGSYGQSGAMPVPGAKSLTDAAKGSAGTGAENHSFQGTGSGGSGRSAAYGSGASGAYRSVNDAGQRGTGQNGAAQTPGGVNQNYTGQTSMSTQETGGTLNMNAQTQQVNRFGGGVDNSRTMNQTEEAGRARNGENVSTDRSVDTGVNSTVRQARQAAESGAGSQSMNGTSTSKWGKDMSIKEQKRARALHAVGDALQMAGGNRTMSQGVKDALGYAKDAALIYSVPEEIQQGNFMTNLRLHRIEKQQRRNIQNNQKK